MHRGTGIFMAVWTGFAVAMLIVFVGIAVRDVANGQASVSSTPYLGVLVAAALVVFGRALWRVGKRLGAKQRTAIENFLRSNLQVHEKADTDSVSYKGFEIFPGSQKLPGQDRWRLEFIVRRYNEKGETILEKTIVADNTFKTKNKADIWAIRLAKQMINGEVPGAILEDT
jgi:hypothetical protein